MMHEVLEPSGALSFDDWSRLCAQRMRHRHNYTVGDSKLARNHIWRITEGCCRFSVRGAIDADRFGGAIVTVGRVSFQFLQWNWETECETRTVRRPEHHLVLYLVLKGSFQARQGDAIANAQAGNILVASSEGQLIRRWSGPCELLNIVISRDVFTRMLATEFGVDVESPLLLEPLAVIDFDKASTLLGFVELMLRDQEAPKPSFCTPALTRQAERMLMHLLLAAVPHHYGEAVRNRHSDIVPYYVRRCDDYIARNIDQNITIEALVNVSGVSSRTLYYGYRKYRGATPMKHIRTTRLHMCREALAEARPRETTVAEVAARFGYSNPSQFSRDYKSHFGTSPVQTLRRMDAN